MRGRNGESKPRVFHSLLAFLLPLSVIVLSCRVVALYWVRRRERERDNGNERVQETKSAAPSLCSRVRVKVSSRVFFFFCVA